MVRALVFVFLMFAIAAPVEAQSRRELAARLDAAEARLAEVEARALQGDPVAEVLMGRLDALEREQRVLTGEMERLAFENRRLRTELEAMGRDVDALLRGPVQPAFGEGPAVLNPDDLEPGDPFAADRAASVQPLQAPPGMQAQRPGAQALPPARNPGQADQILPADDLAAPQDAIREPDALFNEGEARLFDGDFGGAREAFEAYTAAYPEGEQAGEAWFWLGETYFISADHDAAADAYINALRQDRQGPRAPDALVRLAASLSALGETNRACQVLATFPAEFPNAGDDARRKAERESARIGCR